MKRKNTQIFLFIVLCFLNINSAYSQNIQEIELVIGNYTANEKLDFFNSGDSLRLKFEMRKAITEYEKVISGDDLCGKESKALYNTGLCYTWLQKFDLAREYFNKVESIYPDDKTATAYAQYGLAWVDTKEGYYNNAINRLEQKLNEKNCPDSEHNAVMQYQIGRIYLVYLNDQDKANEAFRKVYKNYTDSKIVDHYYMKQYKMKNLNN